MHCNVLLSEVLGGVQKLMADLKGHQHFFLGVKRLVTDLQEELGQDPLLQEFNVINCHDVEVLLVEEFEA